MANQVALPNYRKSFRKKEFQSGSTDCFARQISEVARPRSAAFSCTPSFAAGPPSAARKLRREADGCMKYSLPYRKQDYSRMVSLFVPRAARHWPRISRVRRKKNFPSVRLVFAGECPVREGDNCLLTRSSAYVDLAFSCLLA